MSVSHPVAFCFSDLNTIKHAALFYDTVVPFPLEALPKSEPDYFTSQQVVNEIWQFVPSASYNRLLGPIANVVLNADEFGMAGHKFRAHFLATLLVGQSFGTAILNNTDISAENIAKGLEWLKEFEAEPIVILPEEKLRSGAAAAEDVSITLSNAKLINTEAASWEQIMEVRNDTNAIKKLRNLRLFLQTNYVNKSRQFVEDDLAKRLDDYQNVVKDYGFETLTSALTMITNSKSLIAFGTASLTALLFGESILASASALTGVSLEVAKISLEVATKRHAFQKFKRDHELSYIIDIRDKFGEGKN